MKHKTLISIASVAALFAGGIISSTAEEVDGVDLPTGSLTVDRQSVRSGERARVSWNINFPFKIPEEDLKIPTRTKVQAFMIGTAVSNHRKATITELKFGNNSSWLNLYTGHGSGNDRAYTGNGNYVDDTPYDASVPILEFEMEVDEVINFRAKVAHKTNWVYKGANEVLVMYKGDRPSSKEGWGGDASLEDYIAPYLVNGVLAIGEHDIMIAAELTHSWSNRDSSGYDSNDSIILLRFSPIED